MKTLLRTDYPQDLDAMPKSLVFGELVALAIETPVESYLGDLYWDANWIRTMFEMTGEESASFIFGTRQQGTFISANTAENLTLAKQYNTNVWRVTVSNDDGKWFFEATKL